MSATHEAAGAVLDELERAIVGKRSVLETVLAAMLAGGHVLIEDVPGVAKTLMAKSIARIARLDFSRVQFTPDLVPVDVTGSLMPAPPPRPLEFAPGPLFANLVLGDEINRAPPKTQAAVLEAMAEGQVTVDGVSHRLPEPFFMIATQNPIETEGTYPLPEAQLDPSSPRARVGLSEPSAEREMVRPPPRPWPEDVDLRTVLDVATLVTMQAEVDAPTSRTTWSTTWWRSSRRPGTTPPWSSAPARGQPGARAHGPCPGGLARP